MRNLLPTLAVVVILWSPWPLGAAEPPADIVVDAFSEELVAAPMPEDAVRPVSGSLEEQGAAPQAADSPSDATRPLAPPRPLPPPPKSLPADPAYDTQGEPTGQNPFVPESAEPQPADSWDGCDPDCGMATCEDGCAAGLPRPSACRSSVCRELPCDCPRCRSTCRRGASSCVDSWYQSQTEVGPRRFFTPRFLKSRDITVGGWVDQGVSGVANQPADRYNGPVVFNDRDGEYQMNQLDFFIERKVDTRGCGTDLGGRIDFLYGTDARFVACRDGLEANWDQRERFYQAALPQFYMDAGLNDWTVRLGHFYTIIGYEVLPAANNFFYSHAYTMQYGEPFTHTGMLASYQLGEHVSLSGGFHRGWDRFDDTDGRDGLSFLGGAQWASHDARRSLGFAITSGEEGPGNSTVMYSLVGTLHPTERLKYVLQHDYGQSTGNPNGPRVAKWYGVNQYVFYDLNKKWAVGTRIEWFRDEDGVRVHGCGEGNEATGSYAGDFYEVTLGLNWRPHRNVTLRPEVRWDWYHGPASPDGSLPYDSGNAARQFLYACDLILQF